METQIIELDYSDNRASVFDRLASADGPRVALMLAPGSEVLQGPMDLVLLRRFSDRQQLQVGLITSNQELAARADGQGIPSFGSIAQAERNGRHWHPKPPRELVGLPFEAVSGDQS